MEIRILTQKAEMLPLFPLVFQLNSSLNAARYDLLLDKMLPNGYRMVAVFEGDDCLALSGIWVGTKLYSGPYLEMDNVVVNEAHRSRGIGQLLYDFVRELAVQEGCEMIMLDAYRENERAHAFYERQGFIKRGFHFLKKL